MELISSTLCAKNQRSMVDVDDRDEEKYDVSLIPFFCKTPTGPFSLADFLKGFGIFIYK